MSIIGQARGVDHSPRRMTAAEMLFHRRTTVLTMAAPQSPAALRHHTAPQHADLRDLPFEQACAEIAARHHFSGPYAFQLAPGGATHLVRLSDGAALCGRGPQLYAEEPQVIGPLTCRRCVQAVARRLKGSLGRRASRVTPTRKL
ncbi:hypothetical protein GCM10010840_27420 [Deinococcus aerolatus]|uniref:Uncharacterized protein n=2 Tax=Deinococcus aerolatus TaxID=522487 RepID=A0ABQ2GDQ2_9DEIO|nr:hypothetical protein GCM10010840_27420 [Deinococcus aerolatus]